MADPSTNPALESSCVGFASTHWSVVLAAAQSDPQRAAAALEQLCRTYWRPLYAFVRRHNHSPAEAEDLTQAFFARFLQENRVARADPNRGRFRSFLLVSLKNFLANESAKAHAAKRGGGQAIISLDGREAEEQALAEIAQGLPPDQAYEKRWATTLLDTVLARLRADYVAVGKTPVFEALKDHLWGERSVTHAELGAQLGLSDGASRVAVHRLRARYRELLRLEVASTVEKPEEVEEELRYLISVVCN
jgi:RNA polymerase sigma-70 factor (ECF subfamily)